MALAGGTKVEVLASGEANFEMGKDLIHFRHFRHSKGDGVMKRPFEGQIKAWSSEPGFLY